MDETTLLDFVKGSIDGYLRLFGNYGALGAAFSGATLYVLLRTVGLRKDETFQPTRANFVLWIGGMFGLLLVALNFFAQNIILTYHISIVAPVSNPEACVPLDDPHSFYINCVRWKLVMFAKLGAFCALLGILSFVVWFLCNTPKMEKRR